MAAQDSLIDTLEVMCEKLPQDIYTHLLQNIIDASFPLKIMEGHSYLTVLKSILKVAQS